jgi:O-glycosyl hydrolase
LVDGAQQRQTIEGLGGAMESHDVYRNDSAFWDMLFDDLGVSAINLRLPLDPLSVDGDALWPEEIAPVAAEALSHGVETFIGFSNPKVEWKEGPSGQPGVVHGGTLKPEYYDDYTWYILDQLTWVRNHASIDIDYVSPIPEPNWIGTYDPVNQWPYTYMTPQAYRDLIKIMGPIFQLAGSTARISAPCGNSVPETVNYADTILADPVARLILDSLVTNAYEWSYETNPQSWGQLASRAAQYNKSGTWVGEVSHFTLGGQMPLPHPAGIHTATWLHEALVHGNVSHYYWITMLDFGDYRRNDVHGLVESDKFPPGEFTSNAITKVGYAFRQFARWVRPGAVRIDVESHSNPNVLLSAFVHAGDGTVTVVAINRDPAQSVDVSLTLSNMSAVSGVDAFRTSATEDGVALGSVSMTGSTFSHTLPSESITTFVGDYQ